MITNVLNKMNVHSHHYALEDLGPALKLLHDHHRTQELHHWCAACLGSILKRDNTLRCQNCGSLGPLLDVEPWPLPGEA